MSTQILGFMAERKFGITCSPPSTAATMRVGSTVMRTVTRGVAVGMIGARNFTFFAPVMCTGYPTISAASSHTICITHTPGVIGWPGKWAR